MNNSVVLDALIGLGMPFIIALLNQSQWSPRIKGLIALAACLVASTITEFVRGDVTWSDWRATFLVIFTAALASYKLWWQPSGIAPIVEASTSAVGSRPNDEYGV